MRLVDMPFVRLLSLALLIVNGACSSPRVAGEARRAPPAPSAVPAARVVVGTSGDYAPFSVARGDRFEGFAPALLGSFAASHAMDLAWTPFRWPALGGEMRAGRFEIVADGITVRPERSIAGRFTVPIARGGAVLLLRRPSWLAAAGALASSNVSVLDRAELRIAVNAGAHLERVTRQLFHAADVRAIPDNTAVRGALARGEVDAVMTNTFEAPRWAEGLAGVERVGPLTTDVNALWIRADREAIANDLDAWLFDEEESGRLAALRAKELGVGAGPKTALPVSALSAAIAERLSLMPFVAAAKQRAGLAIEDTSQEARVLAAARAQVERAANGKPGPSAESIDAFFRLQIELAKSAQSGGKQPPTQGFELDRDLRPAIARITARQARIIVRLPKGLDAREVEAEVRRDLEGQSEDIAHKLAEAIVALGTR